MKRLCLLLTAGIFLILQSCEYDHRSKPEFSFSFENRAELDFIDWKCHTTFSLCDSFAVHGRKSLKVTYLAGGFGSLEFSLFSGDWSGRDSLVFSIYIPSTDPLIMDIRLVDKKPRPLFEDLYSAEFPLNTGHNRIAIALNNLKTSGTKRLLNPGNIKAFDLYFFNLRNQQTLYFDHFHLK